jgi:alpha-tubulin suppressor-like RCC1 family protein
VNRTLATLRVAAAAVLAMALVACGGGGDDAAPPAPATPTAPTITTQPQAVSVTEGQPASFSVTAAGSAPLAYQWRRGGATIAGATGATYTLAATTLADSGAQFSVVVSNSAGNVTSANATLTVNPAIVPPAITTQPQSVTVTAGQTATFSVVATGTAPLTYQWRRNGADIAGATGASYTTPATTVTDSGAVFSVRVTNASPTSAVSANATLTVNAAPPAPVAPSITTQPQSVSVTAGQTATFSVVATGTAPLGYQWRRNGANIAGATGASYTTPPTSLADTGAQFSVVVSNGVGSATSAAATLTVSAALAQAPRIVAAGALSNGYVMARSAGGSAWAWGGNAVGKVGDGTLVARATPFQWPGVSNAASLAPGNTHGFVHRADGSALGAGQNVNGELGTGSRTMTVPPSITTPTAVTVLSGLRMLAASQTYTAAVRNDGTVWHWGQLPGGSVSLTAVQVPGLADVRAICVNGSTVSYGLALREDGTVWFWGQDVTGALPGQGTSQSGPVLTAVQVPGLAGVVQVSCAFATAIALRGDGSVWTWGSNPGLGYDTSPPIAPQLSPRQVTGLSGIVQVGGYWQTMVAVQSDGSVWAWGSNGAGQLGSGDTVASVTPRRLTTITDVAEATSGFDYSLFVRRDGTVWAVGSNGFGQLGNPAAGSGTLTPLQIPGLNLN